MMPAIDRGKGMTLKSMLEGIAGEADIPDIVAGGLQLDSRKIEPGDVFVALAGTRCHGMEFGEQAFVRGAGAVLFDPKGGGKKLVEQFDRKDARGLIAINGLDQKIGFLANCFYHRPSENLSNRPGIGLTFSTKAIDCFREYPIAIKHAIEASTLSTLKSPKTGRFMLARGDSPNHLKIVPIVRESV